MPKDNMDIEIAQAPATISSYFTKDKSYLEQLPLELREMVYQNLLTSSEVKRTDTETGEISYDFQPAILGVNHAFEMETRRMLYNRKNPFVVVSTNLETIFEKLERERVPIVSDHNLAAFRQHCLYVRLHFSQEGYDVDNSSYDYFFLMLAQDLPRLVRMIKIHLQLTHFSTLLTVFLHLRRYEIFSTPEMQKKLLEPFEQLHWGICVTHLYGTVNPTYRPEFESKLELIPDNLSGERSRYQLAQDVKTEGDVYYKANELHKASNRYVLSSIMQTESFIWEFSGEEFDSLRESFINLKDRTTINEMLLALREEMYTYVVNILEDELMWRGANIRPYYQAKMWHYLALAHAYNSGVSESPMSSIEIALDYAERASELFPDDAEIKASLQFLQNSHDWDSIEDNLPYFVGMERIIEEEEDEKS